MSKVVASSIPLFLGDYPLLDENISNGIYTKEDFYSINSFLGICFKTKNYETVFEGLINIDKNLDISGYDDKIIITGNLDSFMRTTNGLTLIDSNDARFLEKIFLKVICKFYPSMVKDKSILDENISNYQYGRIEYIPELNSLYMFNDSLLLESILGEHDDSKLSMLSAKHSGILTEVEIEQDALLNLLLLTSAKNILLNSANNSITLSASLMEYGRIFQYILFDVDRNQTNINKYADFLDLLKIFQSNNLLSNLDAE